MPDGRAEEVPWCSPSTPKAEFPAWIAAMGDRLGEIDRIEDVERRAQAVFSWAVRVAVGVDAARRLRVVDRETAQGIGEIVLKQGGDALAAAAPRLDGILGFATDRLENSEEIIGEVVAMYGCASPTHLIEVIPQVMAEFARILHMMGAARRGNVAALRALALQSGPRRRLTPAPVALLHKPLAVALDRARSRLCASIQPEDDDVTRPGDNSRPWNGRAPPARHLRQLTSVHAPNVGVPAPPTSGVGLAWTPDNAPTSRHRQKFASEAARCCGRAGAQRRQRGRQWYEPPPRNA